MGSGKKMKFFFIIYSCIFVYIHCISSKFEPYSDNSGTIVGFAGKNYCLVATDTRLSDQYMIRSRNISKIFKINENVLFSGSGCWSDVLEVYKVLSYKDRSFKWEAERHMTPSECSYLLSQQLYQRRFFPYYCFSLLAGLDESGTGAIYRYDAVGSFERVRAACVGKGEKLIQPLLDELSQMDADLALWKDLNHVPKQLGDEEHSNSALLTSSVTTVSVKYIDISVEAACDLVLKGFMAAAEREISVGDGVEIVILYKNENDIRLDTDQINSKSSFVVKKVADYRRQKYVMENRNYVLPHH